MAAQAIGSLYVSLGLDSAAFTAGIKQAQGRVAKLAGDLNKRLGALGNVPGIGKLQAGLAAMSAGVATAVGAASAAAAAGLGAMSVSAINTAAEIQNLSRIANAAPEEFQKMAYAAEKVGISQEKFSDILKDVNDRVGDFIATGGGPMADFFERIAPKVGVTAEQFRNLSGPKALQLYVDSLEKANVNQQDFTFFMEAMASDSTALLPILKNGGKQAQEYAARLAALGGVMSNEMVAKLSAMKSALGEVGVVMSGIKNALGSAFAPVIEALARSFVSMFEAGAPLRQMFDGIAATVGGLANTLAAVITIVSAIVRGIWDLISAGAEWLESVTGLGSAMVTLWDGTIGAVAKVLIWFADLIKSTGSIGGAFSELGELAALVWQGIVDSARAIPPGLKGVWSAVKADFMAALADLSTMWSNFLGMVIGDLGESINMLSFGDKVFWEIENPVVGPLKEAKASAEEFARSARKESESAAKSMRDSFGSAGAIVADSFGPARSKLQELTASTTEAVSAMTNGGVAGSGLSRAIDGAGKSASAAAAKLTPLQEVMKRLRDEFEKLSATAGMTDLGAKIWGDQKEAGVSAASSAGQAIAALNQQIDALNATKEATKRGEDAFRDLFGSILDGASSAKQAFANLIAEIAKVQFSKGMMNLLGGTSWGSSLIKGVGSLIGSNANGTSNWRGGLTEINERGGEIVDLPSGTRIIPHDVSKRMMEGGGTTRIALSLSPDLEARILEQAGTQSVQVSRAMATEISNSMPDLMKNAQRMNGRLAG